MQSLRDSLRNVPSTVVAFSALHVLIGFFFLWALIAAAFPKFDRFLKTRIDNIDEMKGGAGEQRILELEGAIGARLPGAYKQFFRCTRSLALDGLSFGMRETRRHPAFIEGQKNETGTIVSYNGVRAAQFGR